MTAGLAVSSIGMATPASAHRQDHGGRFAQSAGQYLYLPYMHMNNYTNYVSATNGAMNAWYHTPTKVWPYQTTNNAVSKIDVYTGVYNATWWGLTVNRPCNYNPNWGCTYSYADLFLNGNTMNPETAFTKQAIVVHEVGHGFGLSHACPAPNSCPAGSAPTIMQWGRLPYNVPQTHDINDTNGIYK